MSLKEALLQGKPFKRKQSDTWIIYDSNHNNGWFYTEDMGIYGGSTSLDLYFEDLIAEDWEILKEEELV